MKIYVLGDYDYDGMLISGIYSTKEKAVRASHYDKNLDEDSVHEFELDPESTGDVYVTQYHCTIDPSIVGEKIWHGSCKELPNNFIQFEFINIGMTRTRGFGLTPEEAQSNAEKAQALLHPVWQVYMEDKDKKDARRRLPHPSCVYAESHLGAYAVHEDFNVAKIAVMEYQAAGKLSPYLTVPK